MEKETPELETVTSKRFSLNKFDILKGILMAVGTPVIEYFIVSLNSNGLTGIDWKKSVAVGLSAGLLYVSKNFLSTSTTTVKKK